MKTVSQKTILETLTKHGGTIRWHTLHAKAHLLSSDGEVLGAIRFETYLRFTGYAWIEKTGSDFSHSYYGPKAGACGSGAADASAKGTRGQVRRGDGRAVSVYVPGKEDDEADPD